MSTAEKVFRHRTQAQWGHGIIVGELVDKITLHFEDGQERSFAPAFRDRLELVSMPDAEAAVIVATIRGRKSAPARKPSTKRAAPAAITFEAQLETFERAFPGGFLGETFTKTERGVSGGTKATGYKQRAIDEAREALSLSRFEAGAVDFGVLHKLYGSTNLLFPNEGAIAFASIPPESQSEVVAAVRSLLHGEGEYAARFDAFVAALRVRDAKGAPKRPTWPLVTFVPAVFASAEYAFVKPTLLKQQAEILCVPMQYESLPSGRIYAEFSRVVKALEARLVEAGHTPRDLVDVVAFAWTTLSENAKTARAVAAEV